MELTKINVYDVLMYVGFSASNWEELASRLSDTIDTGSIKSSNLGEAHSCLQEAIGIWLQNDTHASWRKVANAVQKIHGYGPVTAQNILDRTGTAQGASGPSPDTPSQLQPKADKAGAGVITGAQLGMDALADVLKTMAPNRKIAVGVSNETGTTWTARNAYLDYSTTSNVVLPETVKNGMAFLYGAKKVSGIPFGWAGITGALAYSMSDGNTLAVMFSVPYNYILSDNWWNMKVYKGEQEANEAMFDELYSSRAEPIKGNDGWKEKNIGEGYKAKGYMSSSGTAPLLIHVKKH